MDVHGKIIDAWKLKLILCLMHLVLLVSDWCVNEQFRFISYVFNGFCTVMQSVSKIWIQEGPTFWWKGCLGLACAKFIL